MPWTFPPLPTGSVVTYRGGDGTEKYYITTEAGPLVSVTCDDCGRPAAMALTYSGPVRCSACWPAVHGLGATRQPRTPRSEPDAGP